MIQPEVVEGINVEPFEWSKDERKFVTDVWVEFWKMYTMRTEDLDMLGNGRNMQDFWDDSNRDYAVVLDTIEDSNDPVKSYQTTVSRDKSDVYIANLTGQLLFPDVIAQNVEQAIDVTVSRLSASMLYWAHRQDGWPTETGEQKNSRYIHKMVVEGTVHVLDIVTKDGLESELVPNEEVYIGNFWQPNIQKQAKVFRVKTNVLYAEAEADLGHLDNWQYVSSNNWVDRWGSELPFLKDGFEGILKQDRVTIMYVWSRASGEQLEQLKKEGKVKKSTKRACFYNIIVNDILMFPPDNLLPYADGYYPITKGKFCEFAKSEFYYGNSMPNKVMEDKRWIDAWKTAIRYKAKLGLLKPMLVIGGHIDEQIILPSKITDIEAGVEVMAVPGVSDGIGSADIQMLQLAEGEIDRGSVSPQTSGQQGGTQTARAAVIQATNADKLLDSFSKQVAFFMQSRSFPILMRLFELIPKRDIKKIAIPDQVLSDGSQGTFEIIFENPGKMDEMQALQASMELEQGERMSRKENTPKETVKVNPAYLRDLKYYLYSDAGNALMDKNVMKQQKFERDFVQMLNMPDKIDGMAAVDYWLQLNQYPDRLKAKAKPQGPEAAPEGPPVQADAAGAASQAQGLGQLPALAP